MEQELLTPQELFADLIDLGLGEPEPILDNGSKNVLFWHVPAFLKDNVDNQKLSDLTATDDDENGRNWRITRLDKMSDYCNDAVYPFFDDRVASLWKGDPRRDEVISKAEQLIIRNQYNMGYLQAGLFVDYNKLFEVLNSGTSIEVAERIIDNNLFLGNLASFYVNAMYENKSFAECEKAKKRYEKALQILIENPDVHFNLPEEQKHYFKYVEYGQGVKMQFCEPDGTEFCGYGPQYLQDAKIYKEKELQYIDEMGAEQGKEVATEVEARKVKEQMQKISKEHQKLEKETMEELNAQIENIKHRAY